MTSSRDPEVHGPPAGNGAARPGDVILALDSVTAGYGGGDILRGVSFNVAEHEIMCIVGPNGAGKSTLLATISSVLRPRRGAIAFHGDSLIGLAPRQVLAKGIVTVPQAHSLFPEMTVRENVEMGAYTVRDAGVVRRRLGEVEDLFPLVRERAHDKAGSLSGGQQRLVELARSLMLDPSLIVLDEPSIGLDPPTRKTVFRMIRLMNEQGRTILLVEQNARAGLRLSTHGLVLENGKVRLTGTGREILEHPEIGALYLGGAVSPERSRVMTADIVVAGAGHNSLTAAAYLTKAGHRCLVLDSRAVPGGMGRDVKEGRLVHDGAWLLFTCPTVADPSRAPADRHTLKVLGMQPWDFGEDIGEVIGAARPAGAGRH